MEDNDELNAASAVLPLGLRHRCMEKFLRDHDSDNTDYWSKPQCIVFPHLYLNQRAEAAECQICKQRVSLHAILTHAPHRDLLRADLTPAQVEEACPRFGRSHMTRWCQNWRKCLLLQNPRPTEVEKRAYAYLKEKFHRARMSRRKRKLSESEGAPAGNGTSALNGDRRGSGGSGGTGGEDVASSSNSKEAEDDKPSLNAENGEVEFRNGEETHDEERDPLTGHRPSLLETGINAAIEPLFRHLHAVSEELNRHDEEQAWYQHQLEQLQQIVEGLQSENIYLRRENACFRFQMAEFQQNEDRIQLSEIKPKFEKLAEEHRQACEERDKLKGIVQAMKVLVKDNPEANGFM